MRARSRARSWLHALALAAVCLLGCGDDDVAGELGSIHGTVRAQATMQRLKGAKVVFLADTLESYETRTDADGEYDLTIQARSANGRIEASKSGYQTKTVSVYLDDTTVQIDVDLSRAN